MPPRVLPLLGRILLGLGAACGAMGCKNTCTGVGCVEQFAGALVGVLPGRALPTAGAISPLDATYTLAGTKDLGPEADVALVTSGAWVGTANDSAVRRYDLSSAGVFRPDAATATLDGEDASDAFGTSIAVVGDLDGNDVSELAVGAPLRDVSEELRDAGALYVFSDLADPIVDPTGDPWLRISGETPSARLGSSLAACGDLDGDGRADFAASAPWDNTGAILGGSVLTVLSTLLPVAGGTQRASDAGVSLLGDTEGERLGSALACDQDLTAPGGGAPDGLADLIIGAPFANAENRDGAGAVFVIAGGSAWATGSAAAAATLTLSGSVDNAWLGWSVAAGDLDGDGLPEVVSGAPGFRAEGDVLARGEALIWLGTDLSTSAAPTPTLRVQGSADGDGFGRAVLLPDLDGDGLADLAVGAPHHTPTDATDAFESGAVYVFFGSTDLETWDTTRSADTADLKLEAEAAYLRAGQQLRSGDVDGDARDDLAIVERFDPGSGVP